MDRHIVEYIITLIGVLGSSGFFVGFFGYLKARASAKTAKQAMEAQARSERESAEHKRRLEALELRQKQQEAEAEQARLDRENVRHLIDNNQRIADGSFRKDEMWQKVVSEMSERKHEDNKELAQSLNRLSTASENLTGMLEIQSEHLGRLDKTVQNVEIKVQGAVQSLEQSAESIRGDYHNMVTSGISHQVNTEKILRDLYIAINGLRNDVTNIISQREEVRNKSLQGIEAKWQSIEAKIAALIAPRPALLADTPQPVALAGGEASDAPVLPDNNNQVPDSAALVAAEETKP